MARTYSPNSERVLSLVSGYRNPLSWRLAMLQTIIDDSGTRSERFLLAALVAPVSNWLAFTEEWCAELDQPPRARFFKLQDAVMAHGEYFGASSKPEMLAVKIRKFSEIVQRHVAHAFYIDLSVVKFDEIYKPRLLEFEEFDRDQETFHVQGVSSPYFWLAITLLRGMDYQGYVDDEMRAVFDEQRGEDMEVKRWWDHLVEKYNSDQSARRPLVQKTPDYRDDEKFTPLQAANSLAWLVHRANEPPLSKVVVEPPSLSDFLGSVPLSRKSINAGLLKKWAKELKPINSKNREWVRKRVRQ